MLEAFLSVQFSSGMSQIKTIGMKNCDKKTYILLGYSFLFFILVIIKRKIRKSGTFGYVDP